MKSKGSLVSVSDLYLQRVWRGGGGYVQALPLTMKTGFMQVSDRGQDCLSDPITLRGQNLETVWRWRPVPGSVLQLQLSTPSPCCWNSDVAPTLDFRSWLSPGLLCILLSLRFCVGWFSSAAVSVCSGTLWKDQSCCRHRAEPCWSQVRLNTQRHRDTLRHTEAYTDTETHLQSTDSNANISKVKSLQSCWEFSVKNEACWGRCVESGLS